MDENSTHPRSEQHDEDFLAVPRSQAPPPTTGVANPRRTRWTALTRHPVALVTAGVLAGATVVGVAGHELSQPAAATTAVAGSTSAPAGAGAGAPGAGAPGAGGVPGTGTAPDQGAAGGGQAARGGAGGGPGALEGAQQLSGTLSAVDASSITVATAAGSQTIALGASTQVVQDGQEVALSDLATGQDVVLQVYPSADGWAVERVLVDTAAAGSTGSGQAAPEDQGDDQTTATVTT